MVGGFERLTFGARNSAGQSIGASATVPANGATSHAYSVAMQNAATFTGEDLVFADFQGSDKRQGRMAFGSTRIDGATITVDSINDAHFAFFGGTAIDAAANSEFPHFAPLTDAVNSTNCWFILTAREQDRTTGVETFINYVLPNCTAVMRLGDLSFQGKQSATIQITANDSLYNIGGQLFSAMAMAVPDDRLSMYGFHSTNRVHVTTFVQDNTETDITLQYLPLSSVVTINATPNWLWIGGTTTALSSASVTTGVAALAVAGTAAVIDVIMYETNFVASP
jgi:hypothetical protein